MQEIIKTFVITLLVDINSEIEKTLMVETALILFGFKNSVFSFAFPNIG